MTLSVTQTIAEYASGTSFDALPAPVREQTKLVIFDELACGFFGRASTAGGLAARYAVSCGGSREAAILGTDLKVSAPYAAMANGTAGHGDEVDGAHVVGGHPGATIVHASLAMAERQRSTGAELLNAVSLGYDVGTRVVAACGGKFVVRDTHHLTSDLFFALGASSAASRLMGLDARRLGHALALVTFQTNGLYALYSEDRHISKSFCNGQFAFAGVSSALMAAAGLEGNEDIIGSEHGLLETWASVEHVGEITAQLGERFAIEGANFKFLNAGYPIHAAVEAVMTQVLARADGVDDIVAIELGMPSRAMKVVDNRHMHNICVQDMVAASVVYGGLKLDDQPFPGVLENPDFARIRAAITLSVDPEIEQVNPNGRGARATICLRDGSRHSMLVEHPRGHSRRGKVTWDDLADKWRGMLKGCDVEKAMAVVRRLEAVKDVREVAEAFSVTPGLL